MTSYDHIHDDYVRSLQNWVTSCLNKEIPYFKEIVDERVSEFKSKQIIGFFHEETIRWKIIRDLCKELNVRTEIDKTNSDLYYLYLGDEVIGIWLNQIQK